MFGEKPLFGFTLPLHDRIDQHRSIVTGLLHFREGEYWIQCNIGRYRSRCYQIVEIGMEQFVVERFYLGMGKSPEWAQRSPRPIKGERAIEHHPMLPWIIFSSITV